MSNVSIINGVGTIWRHSKLQAPLMRLRSSVSSVWRALFASAGRYRPFSQSDLATKRGDAAPFKGDIPLRSGGEFCQHRLHFVKPRPLYYEVENLVVTPNGGGWKDGALHEKFSSCKPGLRMLLTPHEPARTISEGVFIQSEHIDTYGDWTSEYLAPLARAGLMTAPLLLPAAMTKRPYVIRDAQRLGLNIIAIDEPIQIEHAMVIPQPKVVRSWTPECVSALRKALGVESPPPTIPGSMLYLSRLGETSDVADRSHPHAEVEEIVRQRGGTVLRTGWADLEDYIKASAHVETLLFDHGSAFYNAVYWRPRRIIEFCSDAWWMNGYLFFSNSIGVKDYTLIRSDKAGFTDRLNAALDAPFVE